MCTALYGKLPHYWNANLHSGTCYYKKRRCHDCYHLLKIWPISQYSSSVSNNMKPPHNSMLSMYLQVSNSILLQQLRGQFQSTSYLTPGILIEVIMLNRIDFNVNQNCKSHKLYASAWLISITFLLYTSGHTIFEAIIHVEFIQLIKRRFLHTNALIHKHCQM